MSELYKNFVYVTRCEKCKYWQKLKDPALSKLKFCTYVVGATFVRNADDFCSRAERTDDESH